MNNKVETFTCCGDRRHVVLVEQTLDWDDFPIIISLQGTPSSYLWQRVKDAFCVLMGVRPGGAHYPWDATMLSPEDVVRLKALLEDVGLEKKKEIEK